LSDLLKRPRIAIVGARGVTPYGRQVTLQLAGKLAEQGIVIISGLALGVDSLAHQAALDAGGLTIAVLPGSIDQIAPSSHRWLAEAIISTGGTLVSEYPSGTFALKHNYIARNRLVAGLAQAVLITEAGEKSGSLHTARFALEQGKDVLAVPGNLNSMMSVGTNNLLKSGATLVTDYTDILHALKLTGHETKAHEVHGRNANEQKVLDLLLQGITDGEILLIQSELGTIEFNQVLTMLELGGKVRALGANQWGIR